MIRVLAEPGQLVAGATMVLHTEELQHLRVRRAAAGDAVIGCDGFGTLAEGVLEGVGRELVLRVESVSSEPAPSPLVLAVAAGDRDRFLRLAEQCTELGVTRLIPLDTERARSVGTRLRDIHVEKARVRSREACKQSGNPWATVIDNLTALDDLVPMAGEFSWLLADPAGAATPTSGSGRPPAWLIGPEGGFTDAEREMLLEKLVATPVSLGKWILRFETAAVVAAGRAS